MPSQICSKCEDQLNTAYTFKQQCERTDAALREYTSQPNEIKEESLDIVVKPDLENFDVFEDDNRFSDSASAHSNYSTTVRKKKKVKSLSKQKNRQCRYCDKILTTKEGLKLHERKHTGEKLKQCPICNATFAKTNHLVRHMSSHNKPPDEYKHTCQDCGMGFMRAHHLVKHKQECTSEKEKEDNTAASSSANLTEDTLPLADVKTEIEDQEEVEALPEIPKLRLKKEPEDKLHPCKVCNKILTTAAGLRIHMRRHTGDNLSTCYVKSYFSFHYQLSLQILLSFNRYA